MATNLLSVDPSNRGDHYYLKEEHECYFFYEYTAGQGYAYSQGNQFILNLKKSVLKRGAWGYQYKDHAIAHGAQLLHNALARAPDLLPHTTVCPIPPSKVAADPEHDDRMSKVVTGACLGTAAEPRELLVQVVSGVASHSQCSGGRPKPEELAANYRMIPPAPRPIVILVDDVLTTGAHFIAARSVILAQYPNTRVLGMFMARRALPDPSTDFNVL
jgi:predicted amidophosphoribosyltransferase